MMERYAELVLKAVAGAGDAVIVTDRAGTCIFGNAALTATYGYDLAALEAAGGLSGMLVDEAVRAPVREVLRTGGTFEAVVSVRHQGGTVMPVRLRIDGIADEAGPPVGAISILTPVLAARPAGASDGTPAAARPAHSIGHRLRVEGALIEASHLLVARGEVDFEKMLGIVGEAISAVCVYLFTLPSDDELLQGSVEQDSRIHAGQAVFPAVPAQGMRVSVWHREGPGGRDQWLRQLEAGLGLPLASGPGPEEPRLSLQDAFQGEETSVLAVPVLSSEDKLYGYLGFEYGSKAHEPLEEDIRVLSILGDMLSAYFERSIAEQASKESEERWRLLVDSHPDPILISIDDAIIYINRSGAKLLGNGSSEEIEGLSPFDFISAEHYETLRQDFEGLKRGEHVVSQERDIIRLDGEGRIVEWFSVPIIYQGRHAAQSVLRDVTQRKLAERALLQSEERYRTFVGTISEAIWRVELEEPVRTSAAVQDQVQQVYDRGVLAEWNESMARLLGTAPGEAFAAHNLRVLKPYLSEHLVEEFVQAGYRLRNREYTLRRRGDLPCHLVINAVGTLEGDCLVRIWGSCVDVTERVELERQMVTELERQQQQIGRDLHDGVGQFLTGVRMLSNNLAERFFAESDEGFALARKVVRFAEEASQRVREIYTGLAPVQLYEDGLAAALQELAAHINALPGITCTCLYDGEADVADHQARLHLYRIAQEATNNALKHARPKHIQVLLGLEGEQVVLQIKNDGISFDVNRRSGKSLGLRSMYYRARAIGATFTMASQPDAGTTVRCVLPTSGDAPYLANPMFSDQVEPYL